jgi:small subunit ribosomal protein S7
MTTLVFSKWESNVSVLDPGLQKYINLDAKFVMHDQGRHAKRTFGKTQMHIAERLVNTLMRGGTGIKLGGKIIRGRGGTGKKTTMYKVAEEAFEIVNQKTNKNPMEVLVRAIENAAPREETKREKMGGVIYHMAVDIAPQRRVDFALRNMGKAVAIRSFKSKKTATDALAEELILAANNDPQSHAISRKIEVERVAKSSR